MMSLMKRNGGFTLVELIVVIAILAILAGVVVPAYSGYVEKANKQADITLANEVANALTLNYYDNYNADTNGYVVLTTGGASCEGASIPAAMEAVFGENWPTELKLSYGGWHGEGAGGGTAVNLPAETITSTVGSLTGLAGAASAANSNGVITNVLSVFCNLSADKLTELEQYEGEENYSTIATNLMVKYLAEEIGTDTVKWNGMAFVTGEDEKAMSSGANYAMQYAMLYAMANSDDEYYSTLANTQLTGFNTALENIVKAEEENSTVNSVTDALDAAFAGLYEKECEGADGEDTIFALVFMDYLEDNDGEIGGITSALGTMSDLAADYTDLETLSDENLFSSSAMTSAIEAYQVAASNGGITVQITGGNCLIVPKVS